MSRIVETTAGMMMTEKENLDLIPDSLFPREVHALVNR